MKRRAVLIVGNFSSSWGATPTACEALAAHLETAGWVVFTTSHKPRRLARLSDMLRTAWKQRADYDVACIDVYSGAAFVWAELTCLLLRMIRKPYVLSLHGGGLPDFVTRWGRLVEGLASDSAAVIAQTEYLAVCLKRGKTAVTLIPNGLDVAAYPFRLRLVPTANLVWLRSFHSIYNPRLAVQVLARLLREVPGANLTMLGADKGDGSLAAAKAEAARLGVAHRVAFLGVVPKVEVPAFLGKADVFLNTSDFDNTPVSIEEALACGLCIVSTNVGGMPYLIDNERDGLLTPSGEADAMTAAVMRILTEEGLGRRLSEAARHKAEKFDWSFVLPNWERVLESAIVSSGTSE